MLKHPLPRPRRVAAGGVLIVGMLIGTSFVAWASRPANPKSGAPASGQTLIRGLVVLRVDDNPPVSTQISAAPGESFTAATGEGDANWKLVAAATPLSDGTIEMKGTLTHAGAVVGTPQMIVKDGDPASMKVGEDNAAGAGFKGYSIYLVLGKATPGTASTDSNSADSAARYRSVHVVKYPPKEINARHEGVVYLRAHVQPDGHVGAVDIENLEPAGIKKLGEAARAGVKDWTFEPARRDGKAIASDVIVPVVFTLDRKHAPPVHAPARALDAIVIEGTRVR